MMRPEDRLLRQATAWLDQPKLGPWLRFEPELEERFNLDTSADRGRLFAWVSGISAALYLAWDSSGLLSHIPQTVRGLHALGVVPFCVVATYLFARGIGAHARETLGMLLNIYSAISITILFAGGWWPDIAIYAVGMTTVLLCGTSVLGLRFPWALASTAAVYAIFTIGLLTTPSVGHIARQNLLGSLVVIIGALLVSNWRNEVDQRREFLRALRDRVSRLNLSQRYRELDAISRQDPLTGLANRRAHDAWLHDAWARASVDKSAVGLIVIDVDHFKQYNDNYGHAAGDACLQTLAQGLREQLRGTSDFLARFGGEEFVVVLPGADERTCGDVAERLRATIAALELPHPGIGPTGMVTISAGVASHVPEPGRSPAALFSAADSALYVAKSSGRNRVAIGEVAREQAEIDDLLFWQGATPSTRYARAGDQGA